MKTRLFLALPFALSLLLAPASLAAQEGGAAPPPDEGASAKAPVETKEELLARLTGGALEKIGAIRGLPVKAEVERKWTTRERMKTDMLKAMEEEMSPEELRDFGRAAAFLRLVPEGTDLGRMFSDALSGGVAGYYLPDKKVFYLVEGYDEDGARPIVFHELIHAVEDQYYDYFDRMKAAAEEEHSDRILALKAVVEGSAQRFTQRYMDSEEGMEDRFFQSMMREMQARGPEAMRDQMATPAFFTLSFGLFPYHNGKIFIEETLPGMGEPAEGEDPMARLFRDPPVSTEMVLHPEKYLGGRDLPQTVRLSAVAGLLGEGWSEKHQDTMGELMTGITLNATLLPPSPMMQVQAMVRPPRGGIKKAADQVKLHVHLAGKTGTASAGWDGDRFAFLTDGTRDAVVWASAWDSPKDALEFAETYAAVLGKKYPDAKAEGELAAGGARTWTGTGEGCTSSIRVDGARVFLAERVPAASHAAVADALAATEFTRDPKDALPAE